MRIASVLAVLVVLAAAQAAQADILVGYNVDNFDNKARTTVNPSTLAGVTGDALSASNGAGVDLNGIGAFCTFGGGTTTWIGFGVAPTSGSLEIDSIRATIAGQKNWGPTNWYCTLKESTDNWATAGTVVGTPAGPYSSWPVDLTAPVTVTFTPSSPIIASNGVKFRLYFGSATSDYGVGKQGNLGSNAIQVNGVLAPEPATMGLLAIGGLAALRRRRA